MFRRMFAVVSFAMVVAALAAPVPAHAVFVDGNQYWVDIAHGSDSNPGTSALAPLKHIGRAMALASANWTVNVLPGTYDESHGETMPVSVKSGVKLISTGGSAVTTISGDGVNQVVRMIHSASGTTIDGFTITNGAGDPESYGGGIFVFTDTQPATGYWPLITHNRIVDNSASTAGGGIYAQGATVDDRAKPAIIDNVIEGNQSALGGGIGLRTNTSAYVQGNTIVGNGLSTNGGGIYDESTGDSIIRLNTISNNSALSNGGGLFLAGLGSYKWVEDNLIEGNTCTGKGAGLALAANTTTRLDLKNARITGNSAGTDGGGLHLQYGTTQIFNSVIASNSAGGNGAAVLTTGTGMVVQFWLDTIADNRGSGFDGVYEGNGSDLNFLSSILWHSEHDRTAATAQDLRLSPTGSATFNTCTIRNTAPDYPADTSHVDPHFCSTRTLDYRINIGSTSRDNAGTNYSYDFRHVPRPMDGDFVAGAANDRGAYEMRPIADRVSAPDRYRLAASVVASTQPYGAPIHDVILVCGEDKAIADVLSASGLAWAYDAPILLVKSASVPASTTQALQDIVSDNGNAPLNIHVVGGTGSIPDARLDYIAAQVHSASGIVFDRILATGDRYALARAIAHRMHAVRGDDMPHIALIANGADPVKFFDALALSAVSRGSGAPVLLVKYASIPSVTSSALTNLTLGTRYVGGGPGTVSGAVLATLGATRWSGADRYATAAAIASKATSAGLAAFGTVGVSAGTYEALLGAQMTGRDGGVMLLSRPTALPSVAGNALATHKGTCAECFVYGTTSSISNGVRDAVRTRLQ